MSDTAQNTLYIFLWYQIIISPQKL